MKNCKQEKIITETKKGKATGKKKPLKTKNTLSANKLIGKHRKVSKI